MSGAQSTEGDARTRLAEIVLTAMIDARQTSPSRRVALAIADALIAAGCVIPPATGGES